MCAAVRVRRGRLGRDPGERVLGDLQRLAPGGLEEGGELVRADAGEPRVRRQRRVQPPGAALDELVARGVAVDGLDVVRGEQLEAHDRQRQVLREAALQLAQERGLDEQAGERVDAAAERGLLRALAVGDVERVGEEELAVGLAGDERDVDRRPDDLAAAGDEALLVLEDLLGPARHPGRHPAALVRHVVGVREVGDVAADEVVLLPAEQPAHRAVDRDRDGLAAVARADDRHADRRAVERQPEALLGRAAGLAEHVLAGDVDADGDDVRDRAVVVGEV